MSNCVCCYGAFLIHKVSTDIVQGKEKILCLLFTSSAGFSLTFSWVLLYAQTPELFAV